MCEWRRRSPEARRITDEFPTDQRAMRGPSVARDRCAHDDSGTSMPGCVPTLRRWRCRRVAAPGSRRAPMGRRSGVDRAPPGRTHIARRSDTHARGWQWATRSGATSSRASAFSEPSFPFGSVDRRRTARLQRILRRVAGRSVHPHMPQKRAAPGSHRTGSATRRTEMMDRLWPRRCAAPAKTRRIHSLGVGGRTDFCDAEHSPARPRQEGCQRKRM